MRHRALIMLLFSYAALQNGLAQQTGATGSVKLYRYGDLLRERGIELTKSALLNALRNPDDSVRYLAAMKLAEDKDTDAIPAMQRALSVEKVPRDQVNIALALALLDDPSGTAELRRVCADKSFIPEFRLYAVRYIFDLHLPKDENCLGATEAIAESPKARFGDIVSALELLPRFRGVTTQESQRILEVAAGRLQDPEPVVRMAASQSLAAIGNPAAAPSLEAAITREQDESVRSVLQESLKKLQK